MFYVPGHIVEPRKLILFCKKEGQHSVKLPFFMNLRVYIQNTIAQRAVLSKYTMFACA